MTLSGDRNLLVIHTAQGIALKVGLLHSRASCDTYIPTFSQPFLIGLLLGCHKLWH